jgi:dTDP-4-amino-4,6-dideoxygalactose transaminase
MHSMGYNSRLDDLHAGILSVKLKHITAWTDRRRELARRYDKGLKDASGFAIPREKPGYRHVYHLYVIDVKDPAKRDGLLAHLNESGVDAKLHYPIAIHQQEGYPWGQPADRNVSLPLTERSAASVVSLPMFPELTQAEIEYVVDTVRAWEG